MRHAAYALAAFFAVCGPAHAQALPPEQLNGALQAKAKELEEIQRQLLETQKNLNETQAQGQSLKQELSKITTNITQIALGIKANTVKIGSLSIEIGSIQGKIAAAERTVAAKQGAVHEALQKLQEADDESPIVIFMKNKTLGEAVREQSRLAELNGSLSDAINELKKENDARQALLAQKTDKKKNIEGQYRELAARKSIAQDAKNERAAVLAETKSKEQAYRQMVADLAKRQADIAAEMEAIDAQLRLKINPNELPRAVPGILGWPTPSPKLTQGYGGTAFALKGGYRGHWHNGVDFGGAYGSPILAAEEGTVIAAGDQDLYCRRGAYGRFAAIKHPNNLVTLYGHMSQLGVTAGQRVARGETIGYMGKTGYAFGTHLHFTVYDGTTFSMRGSKTCGPMPSGGDLDPQKYL